MRVKGHKLTVEYSGEVGEERSSTGYCLCGWSESHTFGRGVREEYSHHLKTMEEQRQRTKVKPAKGVKVWRTAPRKHRAGYRVFQDQILGLMSGDTWWMVSGPAVRGDRLFFTKEQALAEADRLYYFYI